MNIFFRGLKLLTISSMLLLPACVQKNEHAPLSTAEIEKITREYLRENPDVVAEAAMVFQAKKIEKINSETRAAIQTFSDKIFHDPRDFSTGPNDAKIQLVEFFDYNCGYCKRSASFIEKIKQSKGENINVIYKEYPVLSGPTGISALASRAALAAKLQGHYLDMHRKLMIQRGLNEKRIFEIARELNLDMERFQLDISDPDIIAQISDNRSLEGLIPELQGTPFFIINSDFVPNADLSQVLEFIERVE